MARLYFYECSFNENLPVEWADIVTDDNNRNLSIRVHGNDLGGYVDPAIANIQVNGSGRSWNQLQMLGGNDFGVTYDSNGDPIFENSDLEDLVAALAINHPNLTIT